jgi:glycosyltransferase involved in cell wall biosynthesis
VKIAIIGTRGVPATYSGFETCAEQVGRRMVERGHEVTVFCRAGHSRERLPEYLGMKLRYLPALREKHLETISHTALSALRLPRRTAIICMGVGNAPVVRFLESTGRRVVFNVDGADWQREKWRGMARRYLRRCEAIAAGGKSAIVADALAVQRHYHERYGRSTELITYGSELPENAGTETLHEFGLEPGGYVLFVGRLVPENGAHDFIDAMAVWDSSVPAVVVGDATYSDDYIASLHRRAGRNVVFTGYQFGARYQQLSHHAGAFVLAATVGGTHPVLVEQMAVGNCVLARDTESNREVLDGTGVLWNTPAELAHQLAKVWPSERRRQLGAAAAARAGAEYSWEEVTSRYLDLCRRSLERVTAESNGS